jgi:hypothetical protein
MCRQWSRPVWGWVFDFYFYLLYFKKIIVGYGFLKENTLKNQPGLFN